MTEPVRRVVLGTRGSTLARWQTEHVGKLLQQAWPDLDIELRVFTTHGDRILETPLPLIGGKGVFTAELESALIEREIDFAVHSLKDLPTENPPGLRIGATPPRERVNDVLVSRGGQPLATLPPGATVGTSSRRRAAQLLYRRPDLQIADIRGNVDTRVRKALDPDGVYDAVVLAFAGLSRLGHLDVATEILSTDDVLPAPGQGALAVQCRDDTESRRLLEPLNHLETELSVTAERAFLAGLGGGCALPIAAYAEVSHGAINLRGRVNSANGREQIDVEMDGAARIDAAHTLGASLAQAALARGVGTLLETLR